MSKLQEHAMKYIKILDSLLKENLDSHDMLFACEDYDNTPMEFCMKPSKDEQSGEIMKKLAILVDKCGGSMKFNNFYAEGTNSIKLVNKGESLLDANEDYFYSDYLIDCLQEKKLKDLNNYRANKSKYCSSLNVMDILNRKKMWNQAERTKESDEEISDFDYKESCNSKYSPKKMWKKSKSTYSIEEDLKILQYIVNHKAFYRVKSRSLWQEMEKKNVCNGRTWQSMKERMKYIIPKIKTFHLDELNQSAIVEGFMNPNSKDGVRYPVYSSSESENEDVLCATQCNDKSVTNSTLVEQNVECSQVTDQYTTLLMDKQMTPSKCGDISNDTIDHQNTHLLTSTGNVVDTSCNSFKLITVPITPVPDVTYTSSTISESLTSDISRCGNAIIESKKNVKKDGVNYSTNSTNSIYCMYKASESTKEENCVKEKMDDITLNEKILTTNDGSEDDVETSLNYNSGKDGENDKENTSFIDETDIEDSENFESMLPGINNFQRNNEGNINSLKTATNNSNTIADRSQLVEMANQSMIVEDKNSDDAENIVYLRFDLECQQSLSEVQDNSTLFENQVKKSFDDDKSMSISMESIDRNDSTHESDYVDNSSDCEGNKTSPFSSNKASLFISLYRRKEETLIGDYLKSSKSSNNMPMDFDSKLVASKHSRDQFKYKITFHKKYGCKRVLISDSKCQIEDSNYSVFEDLKIIKYIYKYSAINCITGNEIWIEMEERGFENKRRWQGLKERFNKRILPNIKYYQNEGVSEKVVNFFFEEYKKKKPDESSGNENDSSIAGHEIPSERSYYTIGEKQAMVDYIIKTRKFTSIKGNILYKTMAAKMPNKRKRTWQSLKNTFKKYIMPTIGDFVKSKDDLLAFKTAWRKSRWKRKRSAVYCEASVSASSASESSDCESSDSESNVNVVTTNYSPKISRDGSDNVNNSSCSRKNLQNNADNINANKGRKCVTKRKQLLTKNEELFKMTPCSSQKQTIPQKKKEYKSMSSKDVRKSPLTDNACSALLDMEQFTNNSIEMSENISFTKNISPNNICHQETEVGERYISPFNGTILEQTEPVQKINSSCEIQIPNTGNEISISSRTPCKKHFKDQSYRALSSCKKSSKTKDIDVLKKNSQSCSASERNLRTNSIASPGRQNKEDLMLDAVKPRPKPKPDTALRKDLRVRKVHSSRKH